MQYAIIIFLLFLLILCLKKHKNAYFLFCQGAKNGVNLTLNLLPYIIAIMLMITLMQVSGATSLLIKIFAPTLTFLGIDKELCEFVCLRPLTGSGSLALLIQIIKTYGVQSNITKSACLMFLTTETVFFSSAVFLSKAKNVNSFIVLISSLFLCFLSMVISANLINLIY